MRLGRSCATREMTNLAQTLPIVLPMPPKEAFPPYLGTHELYVRELNNYLVAVHRNPFAFLLKVEMRRDAHASAFGQRAVTRQSCTRPLMQTGSGGL